MRRAMLLILLLGLALAPAVAHADRPSVAAVHTNAPLRIDGVLDEADWQRAEPISGFRVLYPRENEAPAESTIVRVLYEPNRIVFGIWCGAKRPPRASLTPRDDVFDGDQFAVHIDPNGDGQRAYIFGVNPVGVQFDGILTGTDADFKWDAVFEAQAKRDADAWTAEIAVPFRTMRFPQGRALPWRVWYRRDNVTRNEASSWPLYERGISGAIMLQAADLTGLAGVQSGHDLSITPYVFATSDGVRDLPAGQTQWHDDVSKQAGLDVQAGLTSQLTLNATWNPDFSQIESDALLIDRNQRYPLQYKEKRPFFLEGGDVFDGPMQLIYTRRIAAPSLGVKLTGRAAGTNIGALVVADDGGASMAGSGYGPDGDSRRGEFGVLRATRPFGDGNSVGLIAGGHRMPSEYRAQAEVTLDHAVAGTSSNGIAGADTHLKLGARWAFEGQAAWTSSDIDSVAGPHQIFSDGIWVARLNYKDPARSMQFGVRNVGKHFRDELGFQERIGVRYEHVNGAWNLYPQKSALQRVTLNTDVLATHDPTGSVTFIDANPWVEIGFRQNAFLAPGFHFVEEDWLGTHYHQEKADLYVEEFQWQPLGFSLTASLGDGIYYGDTRATSFLAWTENEDLEITSHPREWLKSAASVKHLYVARRPTHGKVLEQWLIGVNTNVQFTRSLAVRVYPQYDSDSQHLSVNALVSDVLHPGTVLYAGVNGSFDPVGTRQHATARQFFVKASYRFEL